MEPTLEPPFDFFALELDFYRRKHGDSEVACPFCGFDLWNPYEDLYEDDWIQLGGTFQGFYGDVYCNRCSEAVFMISLMSREPDETEIRHFFLLATSEQNALNALKLAPPPGDFASIYP